MSACSIRASAPVVAPAANHEQRPRRTQLRKDAMNEALVSHDGPGHRWLAGLHTRGVQLGLERMRAVCDRLGAPQLAVPTVLVAGTNGKGSVTAMLGELLQAAGCKVGVTISPHLVETRERVRVGGACVAAEVLDVALQRVQAACERPSEPTLEITPFEALTAAAMLCFAAARVDVAVLEVGLGGRLDATNVCEPLVSVVTRIGHDHQAILGNTLAEIAGEKVAIAREGRPLIVSQAAVTLGALRRLGISPQVLKVGADLRIEQGSVSAKSLRTSAVLHGRAVGEPLHVEVGLGGQHQLENAAAAVLAYEALRAPLKAVDGPTLPPVVEVADALADVPWPGRAEIVLERPMVVVDGAHNPEGFQVLRDLLMARGQHWQVILSLRDNRDPEEAIRTLEPIADCFWLPRMQGTTLRPARALADVVEAVAPEVPIAVGPPEACLHQAIAEASPQGGVVVTGSLHAVGEWFGRGLIDSGRLRRWLG